MYSHVHDPFTGTNSHCILAKLGNFHLYELPERESLQKLAKYFYISLYCMVNTNRGIPPSMMVRHVIGVQETSHLLPIHF